MTNDTRELSRPAGCGGRFLDAAAGAGPVRQATPAESPDGRERWVVSRHADVVAALTDPRLSSARGYAAEGSTTQPAEAGGLGLSMVAVDPPDHSRLRRIVVRAFSARRVEALRPLVQQITDDLLDAVAESGQADIVQTFAFPLPVRVISRLLGLPDSVRDHLLRVAGANAVAPMVPMDTLGAAIAELVAERRARPAGDLVSTLVAAHSEDRLTVTELVQMAGLLFAGGYVTTGHLIRNGVLTLLRHPAQLAELRSNPALMPSAVDELLRHVGPVPAVVRYTLDDVDIGGVTIPAGRHVTVALSTANHDPDSFDNPDGFDIHRLGVGEGVAFGQGIHLCLGARLAKLEGEVALGTLFRRFPDLSLAGDSVEAAIGTIEHGTPQPVHVRLGRISTVT